MPSVTLSRPRGKAVGQPYDGDHDGFTTGPDGKDDVPYTAAAKAQAGAGDRKIGVVGKVKKLAGETDEEHHARIRSKVIGRGGTPEQATRIADAMTGRSGAAAKPAESKTPSSPAPKAKPPAAEPDVKNLSDDDLDAHFGEHSARAAQAKKAGDDVGREAHLAKAREALREIDRRVEAKDAAAPEPKTTPTPVGPTAPKPAGPTAAKPEPGEPTREAPIQPKAAPPVQPANHPPTGVKAYAGASESAVAIHAKVLALADENKGVATDDELGRAQTELKSTIARADQITAGLISGRYGAKEQQEYVGLRDKLAGLQETFAKRSEVAKEKRPSINEKAHALILFPEGEASGFSVSRLNRSSDPVPKGLSEGSAFFSRLVGKGSKMDGRKARVITTGDNGRAFSAPLGIVGISQSESAAVVVHEFAHIAERTDKSVLKAAIAFREKRRADSGENYRKLNDIARETTGVKGSFGSDEEGFGDKFFDPYCGKRYRTKVVAPIPVYFPQTGTEIVSMGAQKMHDDPVGFAKSDPEYFQFTLTALQGSRRKV